MNSMTGYGKSEQNIDGFDVCVEIKAVNNRFAEYNIRAPRVYGFLDEFVKSYLAQFVSRGKIDVYVSVVDGRQEAKQITVNTELAGRYITALRGLANQYQINSDVSVDSLMRLHDIFDIRAETCDEETICGVVRLTLSGALERFIAARVREGGKLKADILSHRDNIVQNLAEIEGITPNLVPEYRDKLLGRIKELAHDIAFDENRLLAEVALFADKCCINEEIVRLKSHLEEFERITGAENKPVGRQLDFLLQEMHREINTIGSKSADIGISTRIVNMKTELEKIREQVQNIE